MSRAIPRPVGSPRPAIRPRAFVLALGGACVLAASLAAAAAGADAARLTSITTQTAGTAVTVVIEASEPVPYVAAQPDPLTLVIDIRNVTVAGVANGVGRGIGPVSSLVVEDTRSADGVSVARVRLALAKPTMPRVRSRNNAILVEFTEPEAATAAPAHAPAAVTPPPASAPSPSAPIPPTQPLTGPVTMRRIDVQGGPESVRINLTASGPLPVVTPEPAGTPPRASCSTSRTWWWPPKRWPDPRSAPWPVCGRPRTAVSR